MADNQNKKNTDNMTPEEKQRMHDNYSAMGHVGGQKGGNATKEAYGTEFYHDIGTKGGNARKEQMAHSSSYSNKNEGEENK